MGNVTMFHSVPNRSSLSNAQDPTVPVARRGIHASDRPAYASGAAPTHAALVNPFRVSFLSLLGHHRHLIRDHLLHALFSLYIVPAFSNAKLVDFASGEHRKHGAAAACCLLPWAVKGITCIFQTQVSQIASLKV